MFCVLEGVGRFYHFSRSSWRPAFHVIFIPVGVAFEPLILPHSSSRLSHAPSILMSLHAFQTRVVFQSGWPCAVLWVGSLTRLVLCEAPLPALPFSSWALVICLTRWSHLRCHVFITFSLSPHCPLLRLSQASHVIVPLVRCGLSGNWKCVIYFCSLSTECLRQWMPDKCLIKPSWEFPSWRSG